MMSYSSGQGQVEHKEALIALPREMRVAEKDT